MKRNTRGSKVKFKEPTLSICIKSDYEDDDVEIIINDESGTVIELSVSHSNFVRALSRLSDVSCNSAYLHSPEHVGKTMEVDRLTFPMPDEVVYSKKEVAEKVSLDYIPEGWECDQYYGSQGSFFTKGGKEYASVVIRRYV